MSGKIGVNPSKNSGIIGAYDIRAGQTCEIKTTNNSNNSTTVAWYPFKEGEVTEVSNSNTSLFTADTTNDYGITINYPGRYWGFLQVYYTSPDSTGYSELLCSVWNGSGYDANISNSYGIMYREHTGSNKWLTFTSHFAFDGVVGKTYGMKISVQNGSVQINAGHTKLILKYLGPK